MVGPRRILTVALAASLAVSTFPTTAAFAQTDDERAGARAAADAGLQAYTAKNWSACKDYFTRAEALIDVPPHLLYIARCSVQLGQLVSGREAYLKIRRTPVAPDKPQAFQDAKAAAETELAALEPTIPYLNITVTGNAGKAVSVKMDGADVPPALVGIPHPVDPGDHKVEATADGLAAQAKSVTLTKGQHVDVTLALVPAGSAPLPVVTPPPPDASTTSPTTAPPPDTQPAADTVPSAHPYRTMGFITAGVGVVGLAVGGIFFAKSSSKTSDANNAYDQNNCMVSCTPDQQQAVKDLDSQSTSAKTIAFVTGGVGVAALGVGIVMVFLPARESAAPTQGIKLTPQIGLGSLGLSGSF